MDLLTKYPHALEQLAILKKDYLGVDTAADLSYSIQVGQHTRGNDMRSYKVFGIKDGGAEVYVTTVYSADEGKTAHQMLLVQGYFHEMIVRDVLGNTMLRKDLKKEVDMAA